MDGGTGTGLQAMGVPMDGDAWGGVANLTHLDVVQRLHAAYLAAGAQILITNTFATGPGPLAAAGYGDRFAEANRNAAAAATQARSASGDDDVLVAGSLSRDVANGLAGTGVPFDVSDDAAALRDGYRRQAEVLAEAGVDLLVLEMMGSRTHLEPAVAAATETGLPVWVGLSIVRAAGGQAETIDGEDALALIESLPAGPIDAVFVMHSDVDVVPASLAAVRGVWSGTSKIARTARSRFAGRCAIFLFGGRVGHRRGETARDGLTLAIDRLDVVLCDLLLEKGVWNCDRCFRAWNKKSYD